MGLPWLSECSDVSSVCPCSIWEAPGNSPALCERCEMGTFLYSFLPLQRAQNLQICFREWGKIPSVSNQRRPWSLQSKVLFTHTKKMKSSPKYITIKFSNQRILKAAREKKIPHSQGTTPKPTGQWRVGQNIQSAERKNFQPTTLSLANVCFRNEGQIKMLPDKQNRGMSPPLGLPYKKCKMVFLKLR